MCLSINNLSSISNSIYESWLINPMLAENTDTVEKKLNAYSPHNPLEIIGDSDFALHASVEGWSGDGSDSNPYVISSLFFENSNVNAVNITNTTVYFELKNIIIDNTSNYGIYLNNIVNGYFQNIKVINSNIGITASKVYNCTFEDLIFESNTNGLYLYLSDHNSVKNVSSSLNSYGIRLYNANFNNITDFNLFNNSIGLYVYYSNINNTFYNGAIFNNTNDGIYVYQYNKYNKFKAITCTENKYGFSVYRYNDHNSIEDSIFSNNTFQGMYLGDLNYYYSLLNNTIKFNPYGVSSATNYYANVTNNNIQYNNDYGLFLVLYYSYLENNIINNNFGENFILYGGFNTIKSNKIKNYIFLNSVNNTDLYFYRSADLNIKFTETHLHQQLSFIELHNDSYIQSGIVNTSLGQTILFSTLNLQTGPHEIKIQFQGFSDFYVYNIVIEEPPIPIISSPDDISFIYATTGNVLSWIGIDNNPAEYSIILNGGIIEEGVWQSNAPIEINLDFLSVGLYVVNLRVYNSFGRYASDSVIITVLAQSPTSSTAASTNTSSQSNSNLPIGDLEIGLLSGFVAFGAIFLILQLIRRKK